MEFRGKGKGMQRETVLVTGGSGFIGSNLVRHLWGEGYRVINLDKLTYAAVSGSLWKSKERYVFVQGDVGNRELVRWLLKKYSPRGILHLAAESHVDRSIVDAEAFVWTNVVGTYRLLDEALRYWQRLSEEGRRRFRFVHVSTDEVFGEVRSGYFTETSPYHPRSPYSASKAAGDHFAMAYWYTYGFPVIVTHSSNNYGPFQYPEKLIPLVILRALKGETIPLYGDGSNRRDWIYVEDHVRALHLVFERGAPGERYLIGANNERQNIEIVTQLCSLLEEYLPPSENPALNGKEIAHYSDLIRFVADRPGHDKRYAIDATKIRETLGWSPRVSLEEGLKRTVQWYLENLDWVHRAEQRGLSKWFSQNYSWRQ